MSLPSWTLLPAEDVPCPADCGRRFAGSGFLCFNCRPTGYGMAPLVPSAEARRGERHDVHVGMELRDKQRGETWGCFQQQVGLRLHEPDEGEIDE